MLANVKDTAGLMGEHEVIRAQMDFLTNSLNNMVTGHAPLKDAMIRCRYQLYDLKDGLRRHHESDERVLKSLPTRVLFDDTIKEHKIIQEQIDAAIVLADRALETETNQVELSRYARRIRDTFSRTRRFIETHHHRENALLKSLLAAGTSSSVPA
jgi:hypothetical protein